MNTTEKPIDKRERRGQQASARPLALPQLLDADSRQHGDVPGHQRKHARRKKRNNPATNAAKIETCIAFSTPTGTFCRVRAANAAPYSPARPPSGPVRSCPARLSHIPRRDGLYRLQPNSNCAQRLPTLLRCQWRVCGTPFVNFFVRSRDAQQSTFVKGPADQLQTHRQAILGKSAGNRHRRQTGKIRRPVQPHERPAYRFLSIADAHSLAAHQRRGDGRAGATIASTVASAAANSARERSISARAIQ